MSAYARIQECKYFYLMAGCCGCQYKCIASNGKSVMCCILTYAVVEVYGLCFINVKTMQFRSSEHLNLIILVSNFSTVVKHNQFCPLVTFYYKIQLVLYTNTKSIVFLKLLTELGNRMLCMMAVYSNTFLRASGKSSHDVSAINKCFCIIEPWPLAIN